MEQAIAGVGGPSLDTKTTVQRGWLGALQSIGRWYYEVSQVAVRVHYHEPWIAGPVKAKTPDAASAI